MSVEQADEFNKKLLGELQEKLRKERIFVTQKINKETGMVLKTVYPTYEAYQQEMELINTSDRDSQQSRRHLQHNNEVMTYIGDVPMYQ